MVFYFQLNLFSIFYCEDYNNFHFIESFRFSFMGELIFFFIQVMNSARGRIAEQSSYLFIFIFSLYFICIDVMIIVFFSLSKFVLL